MRRRIHFELAWGEGDIAAARVVVAVCVAYARIDPL
jgi:hypothetical protein